MILRNIREALINLIGSKQRSFLALLGIVIGTASVIAMLNIGTIAQHEALRQFREMGTNVLSVSLSEGRERIRPDMLERLAEVVPQLGGASALVSGYDRMRLGAAEAEGAIIGVRESFAPLTGIRMAEGRFIADLDRFEAFGAVGERLAETLSQKLGRRLVPGDVLLVNGVGITVIGILERKSANDLMNVDFDRSLFMTQMAVRRVLSSSDPDRVVALIRPNVTAAEAVLAVQRHFESLKVRAGVRSADQLIASMQQQAQIFSLLLGAIGGISLVVGGIGVMNVMLVTVSERRREIGIRMAVGARQADIRQQFIVEGVVLAVLGGVVGTMVGLAGSFGFAAVAGLEFVTSMTATVLGPSVSAITGVFFSFYPANQAAKLDPIQALQSE